MTVVLLRQLWDLVETTQSHLLLKLDDSHLVHLLVEQLKEREVLDKGNEEDARQYIHSRVSLIRDLALARQFAYYTSPYRTSP
ncbi:MAG: hypothetical protein HC881_07290 [Leptolyngbyaceae cyanobacterium SL_7_1]|nr:hypothetical protein [Leptolyngbyaceae cyanobacterium SL_7_1]